MEPPGAGLARRNRGIIAVQRCSASAADADPGDHAAAEAGLAVVEHGRLARGDGPLRLLGRARGSRRRAATFTVQAWSRWRWRVLTVQAKSSPGGSPAIQWPGSVSNSTAHQARVVVPLRDDEDVAGEVLARRRTRAPRRHLARRRAASPGAGRACSTSGRGARRRRGLPWSRWDPAGPAGNAARNSANGRSPMKQMPVLSRLSCTGSARSWAMRRTSALGRWPMGNRVRASSVARHRVQEIGLVLVAVGRAQQPRPAVHRSPIGRSGRSRTTARRAGGHARSTRRT